MPRRAGTSTGIAAAEFRSSIQLKEARIGGPLFCFVAVIPGRAKARTRMCNCTSENLEIPGSMLRIAPE
jgi:hypothetical protein